MVIQVRRSAEKIDARRVAAGPLCLALALVFASTPAASQGAFEPEAPKVESLPAPSPHWVFVVDSSSYANTAGRVWIVDGDAQRMVGMIASGFLPTFAIAADGSGYFLGETYWSRGSRGERSDFITHYDARSLAPTTEIPLPQGRFLLSKRFALQPSGDGRLLFSANMRPATSVSVIDAAARTRLAEVTTPGCTLVLPHGDTSFSSLCANGSFMTVKLGPDGAAEKLRGEPFFDPDVDPVFDDFALAPDMKRAFLVSFRGMLHPVDLTGPAPRVQPAWPLISDREMQRERRWRPGGWHFFDYHAASDRLFVLMHRGGEWTQFEAGTEVWIFDAASGRRLERVRLDTPGSTLAVTQDDAPLLFTTDGSRLSTYRSSGGRFKHMGDMEDIGTGAGMLVVPQR